MSLVLGILCLLAACTPHASAQVTPTLPPPCLDFTSQSEAQAFYEAEGGPASDPHGLDPNRDGRACSDETVPGSTVPSVSGTATPRAGAVTSTAESLPSGSSGARYWWIGLLLALGGIGVTAWSLWRRRRSPPPEPPSPPRLDLEELGW